MFNSHSLIGHYMGDYRLTVTLKTSPTHMLFLAEKETEPEQTFLVKRRTDLALETSEQQQEFLLRAKHLKEFRHPFILPVIDAGLDETFPYIITIFKEHGSLLDMFKHHPSYRLPLPDTYALINRIGEALQAAHQNNIIHGNLKPQNILFDIHNNAFLADFLLFPPDRVSTPEQPSSPTKENDQYALGSIAYELLTGQRPFIITSTNDPNKHYNMRTLISPQQLNASLTHAQEQALLKSLNNDPTQRHSDICAFLRALNPTSDINTVKLNSTLTPSKNTNLQPQDTPRASSGTGTSNRLPTLIPTKNPQTTTVPIPAQPTTTPRNERQVFASEIPIHLDQERRQITKGKALPRTLSNRSRKHNTKLVVTVTLLTLFSIGSTAYLYNNFALARQNLPTKTITAQKNLGNRTPTAMVIPSGTTHPSGSTPTPTSDPTTRPTPLVLRTTPTSEPISTSTSISNTPKPTPTPITALAPVPTLASTLTSAPIPTLTPAPVPAIACHISYAVTDTWTNGFTGSINIYNTGSSTINGWTLVFGFPNGQNMTYIWSATATQLGSQVTLTNASYNSTIPVNGSVALGFNASWSDTNRYPTSFILNGVPCD